jgi:tripartite-type tricarboxylate transporter receptor subunit TctC
VSSALYRNLSYDVVKSFAGVGQLTQAAFVVAVNSASRITTMKELIDLAQARPGQVTYSSSGSGAGPHLFTEMIAMATGVRFLHVPFKGSAPATTALLAGQVDFTSAESSATPHLQSGRLRALAVSTPKQSQQFRGIPTMAEAGVPGVEYVLALGIAAPADTPREVILRISDAVGRIAANENTARRLNGLGMEAAQRTADEFHAFLAAEARKYAKLVNDIGLKLE